MTVSQKLKVSMVVACANDVTGSSIRDETKQSPLLHTAIHNLLEGLREREDVEVEVIYGRQTPAHGEDRRDGSIHYVPIKYRPLPVPGMGGPYIARTLALLKHIKKTRPDIVHGQGTERESGLVAALSRRPSILTLHGNFREIARAMCTPPWDYHSLNAHLEAFVVKRVRGILCISNYTKDLVSDLNERNWVLPNAVSQQFFDIINRPEIGRVVCLAAVTERKNQVRFLKAFRRSPSARNLLIEFWGPINKEHSYAKEFISLIDETPNARYRGSISSDRVADVLRATDLLVLPSVEDNCPVCILEAMAAGVPVVASAVGGVPDLVVDGGTGFLASSGQPERLVDHLVQIASDRTLRTKMGEVARGIASQRYSAAAIAETHMKIYREISVRKGR